MKGILRSKSPSLASCGSPPDQPKSILKRANADEDEGVSSSTSSEDIVVPAENDLAARLLGVEQQAKSQPSPEDTESAEAAKGVPDSATATLTTPSEGEPKETTAQT